MARELLRALRGGRSQAALSRRLGYKSNVVHAWEGGRRFPTAAEALRAAARTGVDVRAALARFLGASPPWLTDADPTLPSSVAHLLSEIRAGAAIGAIAERSGCSRYAVSRYLAGSAEPRLPAFLAIVDVASGRLPDLVAEIVDPRAVPSLRDRWQDLERRRMVALDHPWAQAVMRTLETSDYRSLPEHHEGWIAARIGIDADVEARCLAALVDAGLVRWEEGRWETGDGQLVDTRARPEVARGLKLHWARVGAERLERGDEGLWSYNVFNVSRADLEHLRELHAEYFRALRRAIASSEPLECVVVANIQLFELTGRAGADSCPPFGPILGQNRTP